MFIQKKFKIAITQKQSILDELSEHFETNKSEMSMKFIKKKSKK